MKPKQKFYPIVKIKNCGNQAWPIDVSIKCLKGVYKEVCDTL